MSFLRNLVSAELIDIVEWQEVAPEVMVYRFERPKQEIKNGAQLIVRPGQVAVFVDQGHVADVFQPGRHVLSTQNLPVLSTLRGWKHGFESPFKAEVLFVSRRVFTHRKWGTRQPVVVRDPELGALRLRAFGSYSVRVADPPRLVRELVGAHSHFMVDQIEEQLRDLVTTRFSDLLGENRIPALELAASYTELGDFLRDKVQQDFAQYGLEITQALVENVSLPPNVAEAVDRRASMGVVGDLKEYAQFSTAEAMRDAARNPGGGAGGGMGLAMGMAMGAGAGAGAGAAAAGPPPLPGFFMVVRGERVGPMDAAALRERMGNGELTPDTLVWKAGLEQWTPAARVPEVAALFGPPPVPPQAG